MRTCVHTYAARLGVEAGFTFRYHTHGRAYGTSRRGKADHSCRSAGRAPEVNPKEKPLLHISIYTTHTKTIERRKENAWRGSLLSRCPRLPCTSYCAVRGVNLSAWKWADLRGIIRLGCAFGYDLGMGSDWGYIRSGVVCMWFSMDTFSLNM